MSDYSTQTIIKKENGRIKFLMNDFGRNEGWLWGVKTENPLSLFISPSSSLNYNESKVELTASGLVFGFEKKELDKLEKWMVNSLKANKKSVLKLKSQSLTTSDLEFVCYNHGKNWKVSFSELSYIQLGTERFNFEGNFLKSNDQIKIIHNFDQLTKKDLEKLLKWIQRTKKAINKIEQRKD